MSTTRRRFTEEEDTLIVETLSGKDAKEFPLLIQTLAETLERPYKAVYYRWNRNLSPKARGTVDSKEVIEVIQALVNKAESADELKKETERLKRRIQELEGELGVYISAFQHARKHVVSQGVDVTTDKGLHVIKVSERT